MTWWVDVGVLALMFGGWAMHFHENELKSDAYTDLAQIMHDYDITTEALRRTADHDSFIEALSSSVKTGDDE